MTNTELVKKFWNLFSEQKWDEAMKLLDDSVVICWPQSREKMIGPKNFLDVNRYYPSVIAKDLRCKRRSSTEATAAVP